MKNFVIGILISAITIYLGLIYRSPGFILLSFLQMGVIICGMIYILVIRKKITMKLDIPIMAVDAGEELRLYLDISNKSGMAGYKVKAFVVMDDIFSHKRKKKWLGLEVVDTGDSRQYFTVRPEAPGSYEFEIIKIRIYDIIGLFYATRKVGSVNNAIVLPKISQIPVTLGENVRNFYGEADVYDELRPGYDPGELFGVREYRDGDRLMNVHWKLTAKTDELVVRENSLPKACPVVIFLNSNGKIKGSFLEWIISISFSLMDAGCPHYMSFYSKSHDEIIRARVDDEESFYLAFTYYLKDVNTGCSENLYDLYKEKYKNEHHLHIINISPGTKISVAGEMDEKPSFDEFQLVL